MKEFNYSITDDAGIHARPAGMLVKVADGFGSEIEISAGDDKVADAKRLFSVMGLGIKKGDTVKVKINGADEEEAMERLKEFFQNNL